MEMRKEYAKPSVSRVELRPEEVVVFACQTGVGSDCRDAEGFGLTDFGNS
jgi:hypothetical protein